MSKLDWLKQRQKGIDGNDVGAIMGINNKKSPIDIYFDKTQEIKQVPGESEADYWDSKIKNLIAMEFTVRTGKKLRRENKQLVREGYPFMIANIYRRVVGENAIVECVIENSFFITEWEYDEIPEMYIFQCQHNLAVTGCEKCYITVLLDGDKFFIKEIERSEEIIKRITNLESDFWEEYVEKKVSPPSIRRHRVRGAKTEQN